MGTLAIYCQMCGALLPLPEIKLSDSEKREVVELLSFPRSPGKIGGLQICGKDGHVSQVALLNAKFCAICGAKLQS